MTRARPVRHELRGGGDAGSAGDVVTAAVADAITEAAAAGRYDALAQLVAELEAQLKSRSAGDRSRCGTRGASRKAIGWDTVGTYAPPLTIAFGLVILLDAAPGRAEWSDPIGPLLLPGLSVGSAARQGSPTVFVGAEVSVAKSTRGFSWFGAYTDVVWLPDRDRVRLGMGPEFGFLMFGVDGGPVFELDERGSRGGVQVRPLLSFVWVHLAARFGRTFGEQGSHFQELGLLLKYPIELKRL